MVTHKPLRSLASKIYIFSLKTKGRFVFHPVYPKCINHHLILDFDLYFAHAYLVFVAITLTISVLPYPFLSKDWVWQDLTCYNSNGDGTTL